MTLVEEQERADRAKAAENEIRGRVIELENDLKKEKDKLFCIVYYNMRITVLI